MNIGIIEIIICILAVGLVLRVTRKRPVTGMLLTVGLFIIPAVLLAAFVSRHEPRQQIRIVSSDDGESGNHVTIEVHDCEESGCWDCQDNIELALVSHREEEDEPDEDDWNDNECSDCEDECEDCDETVAEVSREEEFAQETEAELLTKNSTKLDSDRPDWIYNDASVAIATNQRNGKRGELVKLVVQSGPFETREECESELIWSMKRAVGEYAEKYLQAKGQEVPSWFRSEIPGDELYEAVSREYDGVHEFGIANTDPMPVKYVELTLDRQFHERVVERPYERSMQLTRVAQSGLGSLGVLGLIAAAFGMLKVDDLTGTKYRKSMAVVVSSAVALLFGVIIISILSAT